MTERKNKQQVQVDIAVKAAKDRRQLIEVATRGQTEPERLSLEEIRQISTFVATYGAVRDDDEIG